MLFRTGNLRKLFLRYRHRKVHQAMGKTSHAFKGCAYTITNEKTKRFDVKHTETNPPTHTQRKQDTKATSFQSSDKH